MQLWYVLQMANDVMFTMNIRRSPNREYYEAMNCVEKR